MNEIICPHCTKAFKIDEASYAEKSQDVTIKKLTKGNSTMAAKFAELKASGESELG